MITDRLSRYGAWRWKLFVIQTWLPSDISATLWHLSHFVVFRVCLRVFSCRLLWNLPGCALVWLDLHPLCWALSFSFHLESNFFGSGNVFVNYFGDFLPSKSSVLPLRNSDSVTWWTSRTTCLSSCSFYFPHLSFPSNFPKIFLRVWIFVIDALFRKVYCCPLNVSNNILFSFDGSWTSLRMWLFSVFCLQSLPTCIVACCVFSVFLARKFPNLPGSLG